MDKLTPEQYIINNYGVEWLRFDWASGDVEEAIKEYAELKTCELQKQNKELARHLNRVLINWKLQNTYDLTEGNQCEEILSNYKQNINK